jgi:hypothetical protein
VAAFTRAPSVVLGGRGCPQPPRVRVGAGSRSAPRATTPRGRQACCTGRGHTSLVLATAGNVFQSSSTAGTSSSTSSIPAKPARDELAALFCQQALALFFFATQVFAGMPEQSSEQQNQRPVRGCLAQRPAPLGDSRMLGAVACSAWGLKDSQSRSGANGEDKIEYVVYD